MKLSYLIPATFLGGPIALLLPAWLMHVMPLWAAFAVGAAAGLAFGLSIIRAIANPAPQRN